MSGGVTMQENRIAIFFHCIAIYIAINSFPYNISKIESISHYLS